MTGDASTPRLYLGSRRDGERAVRDIRRGKRTDVVVGGRLPRVWPQQIQAVAKPDKEPS